MNIKKSWSYSSPCTNPQLAGDLAAIVERAGSSGTWEYRLEKLWNAARYLDDWELSGESREVYDWNRVIELTEGRQDPNVQKYLVTTSSGCVLL